ISIVGQVSATGDSGSGGIVAIDAASALTVDGVLDVSAPMGDAGEIDLNPNDRNVDVVVNAKLDASAGGSAGMLAIGISHDITFTKNSSVKANGVGTDGSGGEVDATA